MNISELVGGLLIYGIFAFLLALTIIFSKRERRTDAAKRHADLAEAEEPFRDGGRIVGDW